MRDPPAGSNQCGPHAFFRKHAQYTKHPPGVNGKCGLSARPARSFSELLGGVLGRARRAVGARSRGSAGAAACGARSQAGARERMAGLTGLEPATSCVTGRRSNQLNYNPAPCTRSKEQRHNVKERGTIATAPEGVNECSRALRSAAGGSRKASRAAATPRPGSSARGCSRRAIHCAPCRARPPGRGRRRARTRRRSRRRRPRGGSRARAARRS